MFLHFEDWTQFIPFLDKKGIPHGDRIIKVFATDRDPRETLGKPTLRVVEIPDSRLISLSGHKFHFPGREKEVYSGEELEQYLESRGLNDFYQRQLRALFLFATREDTRFAQEGMAIRVPCEDNPSQQRWLIDHPFQDIDGLDRAVSNRGPFQEELIHLDIFSSPSLERLRQIVDFKDPSLVLSWPERVGIERQRRSSREGPPETVEQ